MQMTPNSELKLRPAEIADLLAICSIMRRPEVRKNQYWINDARWHEFAEATIRSEEASETKIDVIEVNGNVAGYVVTRRQVYRNHKHVYLSFNLQPELWGRGLMNNALKTCITDLFLDGQTEGAMVECFSGNHRCRRLLQKLAFESVPIPVVERLSCLVSRLPIRWVLRYWLSNPMS